MTVWGGTSSPVLGVDGRHRVVAAAELVLKRQESLPVSTMWQWWVSRSSHAVVILASPNTLAHSVHYLMATGTVAWILQSSTRARRAHATLFGSKCDLHLGIELRTPLRSLQGRSTAPLVVAARRHVQHRAHHAHPELLLV